MSSERSLVRTYGEDRFVVSYRSSGLGQSQGDIRTVWKRIHSPTVDGNMSSERSLSSTYGEDRFVDRFVVSYRLSGLGQSQGDIGLYGKAYILLRLMET